MNVKSHFRAITQFLNGYGSGLLDLVYPPVCGICGAPADSSDRLVCERCWESIQGLDAPYCVACRQFLTDGLDCPVCEDKQPVVFALGFYDETMQTLVHDLKFYGLKPLAESLGDRLARIIADYPKPVHLDVILPVPLHPSRRLARGFNQSEEIARSISERLAVPHDTAILYATRRTRQQARLSHRLRERNVRGAFAVDDQKEILKNAQVLLVDDVTTTGATLRENARVLFAAGAKSVVAAVVASAV
jgi:ComF family protein